MLLADILRIQICSLCWGVWWRWRKRWRWNRITSKNKPNKNQSKSHLRRSKMLKVKKLKIHLLKMLWESNSNNKLWDFRSLSIRLRKGSRIGCSAKEISTTQRWWISGTESIKVSLTQEIKRSQPRKRRSYLILASRMKHHSSIMNLKNRMLRVSSDHQEGAQIRSAFGSLIWILQMAAPRVHRPYIEISLAAWSRANLHQQSRSQHLESMMLIDRNLLSHQWSKMLRYQVLRRRSIAFAMVDTRTRTIASAATVATSGTTRNALASSSARSSSSKKTKISTGFARDVRTHLTFQRKYHPVPNEIWNDWTNFWKRSQVNLLASRIWLKNRSSKCFEERSQKILIKKKKN